MGAFYRGREAPGKENVCEIVAAVAASWAYRTRRRGGHAVEAAVGVEIVCTRAHDERERFRWISLVVGRSFNGSTMADARAEPEEGDEQVQWGPLAVTPAKAARVKPLRGLSQNN